MSISASGNISGEAMRFPIQIAALQVGRATLRLPPMIEWQNAPPTGSPVTKLSVTRELSGVPAASMALAVPSDRNSGPADRTGCSYTPR
jgi:hypothetical protein